MLSRGFCRIGGPQSENQRKRRELKKLWNVRVTVIPIIIGELGTVPNCMERRLEEWEIGGRIESIQTIAFLRSLRILRRVLETWGDLLCSDSSEIPSTNADVNNSQETIIIIIITALCTWTTSNSLSKMKKNWWP